MPEIRMTPEQIQRDEELHTAVSALAPDAFDEPPMRDNIDEMPHVDTVIAVPQDTLGAASSSSAQDTTAPSLLPAGFVLYGRPWSMSCTFSPGNPADVLALNQINGSNFQALRRSHNRNMRESVPFLLCSTCAMKCSSASSQLPSPTLSVIVSLSVFDYISQVIMI